MALTTKVLLNKVRQKNDGTFPLTVRITYNRKITYLPLGYNLSEKDFDAKNQRIRPTSKIAGNITRLNNHIQSKVKNIYDTIARLEENDQIAGMSMPQIKNAIEGKGEGSTKVFDMINAIIKEKVTAKNQGGASPFCDLKRKLLKLGISENITFTQINYKFLKDIETQHYAAGHGAGGLSVYLRTLRIVYNRAIKENIVKREYYPFSSYTIKSGVPDRHDLGLNDLETLKQATFNKAHLSRSRDLFMASFYLRGMNWLDMAQLKLSNIQGDFERINYIRSKTKNKRYSIKITPPLLTLLKHFIGEKESPDDYVFPIIGDGVEESFINNHVKNKRGKLNRYLKIIARELNIPAFSIYTARHTYAMTMKRNGAPTNIIQDSLGHTTEATTQAYLDSFETNVIDEYDEKFMV